MVAAEVEPGALGTGFAPTKRNVLLYLKRTGESSLAELAKGLGISKMATLRHVTVLEGQGLLERSSKVHGRGRPRVYFRLTPDSTHLFPAAYAHLATTALEFIDRELGREAVVKLLENRARELYDRHHPRFDGRGLREKVQTLATIRDEEGYMAELGPTRKSTLELLEHNCPIVSIAGRFGEACAVEQRLFENLLHADVETTHRVVAGAPVCRFLIRARGRGPLDPASPPNAKDSKEVRRP